MTVSITHSKVSAAAVGSDSTRIYSDSWNANHVVPVATSAEAIAAASDTVLMTPAKTKTLIDSNVPAGSQPIDTTLTAFAAYNTAGLITQTAADTFTGRTITGTANQVTVTNGDGVSGNPTLSLPSAVTGALSILVANAFGAL